MLPSVQLLADLTGELCVDQVNTYLQVSCVNTCTALSTVVS